MPEKAIKTFGAAVRDARKKRSYSQQRLTDVTGISKRHIAKIENGISNPSFEIVAILAYSLDISIDQILFSDDFSDNESLIRDISIQLLNCKPSQRQTILKMIELMVEEFSTKPEDESEG